MRKVLLFLLLFGGGLAVLLFVVSREKPREQQTTTTERTEPEEFPQVPISEGQAVGVLLEGRHRFTTREETGDVRRPLYDLEAQDVEYLGRNEEGDELYELRDIELDVFDKETGELRMELDATSSQLPIATKGIRPELAQDDRIVLVNVETTVHRGAPIVPFHLRRVPRLEVVAAKNSMSSTDAVQMDAPGLEATGLGMSFDGEREVFVLRRSGNIRAVLDPVTGFTATLVATGPGALVFKSRPDIGARAAELSGSEGTDLTLTEPHALHLTSSDLSLVGNSLRDQTGEEFFRPVGMTADRDVVLERGDAVFFADHAEMEFEDVELRSILLSGNPRGTASLDVLTDDPRLKGVTLELDGEGPLRVGLDVGGGTEMFGPCRIVLPERDAQIDAREWIRGTSSSDRRDAVVRAKGDVVVRYGDRTVRSDEIEVRFLGREQGLLTVVSSELATVVEAVDQQGRPLTLDASRGLELRTIGKEVEVPWARDVRVTVEGKGGYTVEAGEVRDFDLVTRTFKATGGVVLDHELGRAVATTAEGLGPKTLDLHGTEGEAATFTMREGELGPGESAEASAQFIHLEEDRVRTSGASRVLITEPDKSYDLASERLSIDVEPLPEGVEQGPRPYHLRAEEVREARLDEGEDHVTLSSDWLEVDGVFDDREGEKRTAAANLAVAGGNVVFQYEAAEATLGGEGDHLILDDRGGGILEAAEGGRVRTRGSLPGSELPYVLEADVIEFADDGLWASVPKIRLDTFQMPINVVTGGVKGATLVSADADNLTANKEGILLSGDAVVHGTAEGGEQWWLEGGFVQFTGPLQEAVEGKRTAERRVQAWGGFRARIGASLRAQGERFDAEPDLIRVEGAPAQLDVSGIRWESRWIEYDAKELSVASDRGTMRVLPTDEGTSWNVRYESLKPFVQEDSTLLVLQNPVLTQGVQELRARWAIFWIDRGQWRREGGTLLGGGPDETLRVDEPEPVPEQGAEQPAQTAPNLFGRFRSGRIAKIVSEIYVEGNVEVLTRGERFVRAEAIYLDLVDGHGWIQDADVTLGSGLPNEGKLHARTKWLRHSSDGSLQANKAVLTTCDFDRPHYVLETGDFRLTPVHQDGNTYWKVRARKNRLRLGDHFAVPFPSLPEYESTQEGIPRTVDKLRIENSARFGTALGTSVNRDLGTVGNGLARAFGFDPKDVNGKWNFDGSWLGSRGPLLGVGLDMSSPDVFWSRMKVDGVYDSGNDKGVIRVPKDERNELRIWGRARARWFLSEKQYVHFALSDQSDPAVQSEFFEADYLRYEQRENYVRWRKAWDDKYSSAIAETRLDDWRTVVERLPEGGYYRGRSQIASIGSAPLLWTTGVTGGYIRRVEGDPTYDSTFRDPFGDRETARVQNTQRFEVPVPTGFGGLKATPFVEANMTGWSEGVDESEGAYRVAGITGIEMATRVWRDFNARLYHELVPTIAIRTDAFIEESDNGPVAYDSLEAPVDGTIVDLRLRSRLLSPGRRTFWDVQLRASHASDRTDGEEEGWLPFVVLSDFRSRLFGVPFGFTNQTQYDLQDGNPIYWRSTIGFQPVEPLGLEFGYSSAEDQQTQQELFRAIGVSGIWIASEKWEFEGRQSVSLLTDGSLYNQLLVRRKGHDMVFELELANRLGEGSTIAFNFKPLLLWKRNRLGYVDYLNRATL